MATRPNMSFRFGDALIQGCSGIRAPIDAFSEGSRSASSFRYRTCSYWPVE